MTTPRVRNETSDKSRDIVGQDRNPVGARIELKLAGRSIAWLSQASGVPENTLRDAIKRGISRTDVALKIASALNVSVDWLLGAGSEVSRMVRRWVHGADDVDFVWVPQFDLREIRDEGKSAPIDRIPFRKDWLHSTLGTSAEPWITTILADYPALDLFEGDQVFVREVEPIELIDGQTILFRLDQGLAVAKYRVNAIASGDDIVASRDVAPDKFVPVARILGKLVKRF